MLPQLPETGAHANINNQVNGRRKELLDILGNAGFAVAGISTLGYMGQVMHIIPINGSFFLLSGGIGLLAGVFLKK